MNGIQGEWGISRENKRALTPLFLLFCVCLFNSSLVYGDVTAVLEKQTPSNDVVLGNNVTYSLTVTNTLSVTDDFSNTVFISLRLNGSVVLLPEPFSEATGACFFGEEGVGFQCNPIANGTTHTYQFVWTAPPVGVHRLTFDVSCSIELASAQVACNQNQSVVITQTTNVVAQATEVVYAFSGIEGLSFNEAQVVASLERACTALESVSSDGQDGLSDGQAELLSTCQSLDSSNILTALQQLTPTQAPAQGRSSIDASNKQSANINARMSVLRRGYTGVSVSGLRISFQDVSLPASIFSSLFENKFTGDANSPEASALYGRLGVFVNGNISIGDRDATSNEAGFDFSTEGITVGADYRLNRTVVAGIALGYVDNETKYGSARGRMDVQGYSLSLFGSYYRDSQTYWDVIASIGKNNFDSQRNIKFGTISEQASGGTDGFEFSLGLGGGYDYNRGSFTFGPYGRINLIHADIDAYAENSSSGFELNYGQQSVTSLTTTLGAQANLAVSTRYGILSPQLRFEWLREFEDEGRYITASFVHDPGSSTFKIGTDAADKNFWNIGLGASATFSAGRSAFFYIDTVAGKDKITQNTYSTGFRMDY